MNWRGAGGPAPAMTAAARTRSRRRWAWLAIAALLVVAFAVGTRRQGRSTMTERVRSIAATVRCPTCSGQSAATSDAPASAAIRREIEVGLRKGLTADQIRAQFATAYGDDILLTPQRSGAGGFVWGIPVAAGVLGVAGLVWAFRRWRAMGADTAVPDEDRRLVEAARQAATS